jgi:hypothetical protein
VRLPEWEKGLPAYPAAYQTNQNIYIEAVFSAAHEIYYVTIKAHKKDGDLGDIIKKEICFNNGSSFPDYFQVSTLTPQKIKSFHQEWKWYWQLKNKSDKKTIKRHIGNSRNKIYIVLNDPGCPWGASKDTKAWTDVLDYSCMWAAGETTAPAAASQIARHLYSDAGGTYDNNAHYYTGPFNESFKLSKFLNNLASQEIGDVSCHAMGKSQVIFSNVLGCGLMYWVSDPFGKKLNPVILIGEATPRRSKTFHHHAFGSLNKKIFDACLQVVSENRQPEWMTNICWEAYKNKVVKVGEVEYPSTYTFPIGKKSKKKTGHFFQERLKKVKKEYNYANWGSETGEVIAGVDISKKILPQLCSKKKVWKNDDHSIQKIHDTTCTVIYKWWREEKAGDDFRATMVACPTFAAAKKYLITRYAGFVAPPSSKKQPGAQFGLNIGSICFVAPRVQAGSRSFSTIDFIRHNVLFLLSGRGKTCKELAAIAETLDDLLKKKKPVKSYNQLKERPRITHFSSEKKKITVGESVRLHVKVKNPLDSELYRTWRISSGGIEGDPGEGFFFYGEEEGRHNITHIIINNVGLYDCKSLIIEVCPEKEEI